MNFILGSGLVGNIAKRVLGESWEWVPFKRSRYYSFELPLADNFIVFDKAVDGFMTQISPNTMPLFLKRPISYQGMLMYQDLPIAQDPYLRKIYGDEIPPLANSLLKTTYTVYPMSATSLYQNLEKAHKVPLIEPAVDKYGEMTEIDLNQKTMTCRYRDGGIRTFEFDKIISTIPLNALYRYCKLADPALKSKAVCYYHIVSDSIDLEGAEQALVADLDIKFFKVYQIKKNHYVFCTFDPLENPLAYLGGIINYRIDILEAKRIEEALPVSVKPDISLLESKGITCVGSNAQWDDFMDVSSCIKRLLSYASR